MGRDSPSGRYRHWFVTIAAWFALSPAALADPRPFRLVGNQIVLPVKIEGRETLALLDTGSNASLMTDGLAESLSVKHRKTLGRGTVGVSGEFADRRLTPKVAIDLGSGVSLERRLGVVPSSASFAAGVQAIIGMDVLYDQVVAIDFERLMIDIGPSRSFKPPAGPSMPFTSWVWDRPTIRAELGGQAGDFLIDTAASSALHLFGAFEQKASVTKDLPASATLVSGIDGAQARPIVSLPSVTVGGKGFESVPTTVGPIERVGIAYGANGVIGVDLLKRFNLVIDFGRSRMWMTPNSNFDDPFRRNRIGVITGSGGGRGKVRLVAPGSPAERAGFRIGETIAVFETEAGAAISDLLTVSDGEHVTAVMTDGSRRKLTAQAYY